MNCFSELKYSMYVDGELAQDEARLLEAHLFVCPRCRVLVEGLRAEARLLAEVLQTTEAEEAKGLSVGRSLLWTIGSAVALVLILKEAADWLGQSIPSTAEWLNPFHSSTLISLLFSFSMWLRSASEGVTMFNTLIIAMGAVILGLLSLLALYLLMRRRWSLPAALLASLALVLLLPSRSSAVDVRHGGNVRVSSAETVDSTLIAAADTVDIDGTVNGDLIVSGRSVNVRGTVKGDVLCFCGAVDFRGNAVGNLYGFARRLDLRGTVERNLYGWVQALDIDNSGRVGGDVVAGTTDGRFDGAVGRDMLLGAGNAQVEGNVGRDVRAYVGDVMTLSPPGRIGGNLRLLVKEKEHVRLDPAVSIGGTTEIRTQEVEPSRYTRPKFYFWEAVKLAAALLTGLLVAWLFPALFRTEVSPARAVGQAMGIGFLALVAAPVAAIILAITLVGLPIAILTLFAWLAGLYLAKVFVGAYIGAEILKPEAGPRPFALSLLLGLFIIYVATNLPYVGVVVSSLVVMLGLGTAVKAAFSHWRGSTA